jgi:hypothetical protein
MTTSDIKTALERMGYELFNIVELGNHSFKITITGACHVQQIKDILPIAKWEYDDDKVLFWI